MQNTLISSTSLRQIKKSIAEYVHDKSIEIKDIKEFEVMGVYYVQIQFTDKE